MKTITANLDQAAFVAGAASLAAMGNILQNFAAVFPAFAKLSAGLGPAETFDLLDKAWDVLLDPDADTTGTDPERVAELRGQAGDVREALQRIRAAVQTAQERANDGRESEA